MGTSLNLLYLHGFESSPQSAKAQAFKRYCAKHHIAVDIPQLPAAMSDTAELLLELSVAAPSFDGVLGSSLGGFWAHYMQTLLMRQGRHVPAIFINPAVEPAPRFCDYQGRRLHPYLDCEYHLGTDDILCLTQISEQLSMVCPQWIFLQQGDETLDFRDARAYYRHQRLLVEANGSHRYEQIERYFPAMLEFLKRL